MARQFISVKALTLCMHAVFVCMCIANTVGTNHFTHSHGFAFLQERELYSQ